MDLSPPEMEAIHGTLVRLERPWIVPLAEDPVRHQYDPLPVATFLEGYRQFSLLTEGRRFLDIGCGIGRQLALMHGLGWQVSGIELRAGYVAAAAAIIPEAAVICSDAFDIHEFEADVVYMYRPMRSDEDQEELEAHVLAHTQPGTVMYWPMRHAPEAWVT